MFPFPFNIKFLIQKCYSLIWLTSVLGRKMQPSKWTFMLKRWQKWLNGLLAKVHLNKSCTMYVHVLQSVLSDQKFYRSRKKFTWKVSREAKRVPRQNRAYFCTIFFKENLRTKVWKVIWTDRYKRQIDRNLYRHLYF